MYMRVANGPKSVVRKIASSCAWTAASLLFVSSNIGCSSLGLGKTSQSRTVVVENSWVRSTSPNESLGFRRMNRMAPLVLDTVVIQANGLDGISAFDRKSGSQLWRLNIENGVEGGAQAVGDKIYFGAGNGLFYCVGAADGRVHWTADVRSETLAPPTVEGGVVYFQSGADVLYALDAATGKQLWLYNRQVSGNLSIRATTRPVVAGNIVLAGFSDGYLVAVRKSDAGLVWERKLGLAARFLDVDATPVVDGANIFVSSYDAALYSLNLETGNVNWTVEEGAYVPVTLGSGTLNDRLFYSTTSGKILSIDKASGKVLSTFTVTHGIATQVSLYRGLMLYGESEGALVLADPNTGKALSKFTP